MTCGLGSVADGEAMLSEFGSIQLNYSNVAVSLGLLKLLP